jgi:Ca-activated chloride channel family protein
VSFEHPLLLLTLLAVPATVALLVAVRRRRMRHAVRFTNLGLLARVAENQQRWRRFLAPALFLLALACAGAATARPHVNRQVLSERATVVLVIDASRSMQATDVRPSRLAAARSAANVFLDKVPKRLRVALIVFSGDVTVAAPPTRDHDLVRRSVAAVGTFPRFGGTAIGDALVRAVEVGRDAVGERSMAAAGAPSPPSAGKSPVVSILFLSDGRQNRGLVQPLAGAARARAAGMPVYTVSLGTPDGVTSGGFGGGFGRSPDPETLRAIARVTGGEFTDARTAEALKASFARLGERLGREPGRSEVTHALMGAAAAALVAAGLLFALWRPRLP